MGSEKLKGGDKRRFSSARRRSRDEDDKRVTMTGEHGFSGKNPVGWEMDKSRERKGGEDKSRERKGEERGVINDVEISRRGAERGGDKYRRANVRKARGISLRY